MNKYEFGECLHSSRVKILLFDFGVELLSDCGNFCLKLVNFLSQLCFYVKEVEVYEQGQCLERGEFKRGHAFVRKAGV